MNVTRFLVVGAAGHAQEVAWSLREVRSAAGLATELLFFDDRMPPGPLASGLGSVVGSLDVLRTRHGEDGTLVMGIGLPESKAAVVARLGDVRRPWATVIHPRATIGPNVAIGEGSYVAAGAILTVNVRVGRFATINMHCQAAHDDVLGDFVTLHPDAHLAGDVWVGDRCEIGSGAVVIPGVRIGARSVVGAGCVVLRSLSPGGTYVGVPAQPIVRREQRTG
jgi:sugar O-acyltransferase (sialic acid O-acetyltransferase NeuD family)